MTGKKVYSAPTVTSDPLTVGVVGCYNGNSDNPWRWGWWNRHKKKKLFWWWWG